MDDAKKGKFKVISLRLLQTHIEPKDVLKNSENLKPYQQNEDLLITYGVLNSDPTWKQIYDIDGNDANGLRNSNAYLLLFVKFGIGTNDKQDDLQLISHDNDFPSDKHRWMVISHGMGHRVLIPGTTERFFGLNVVLNVINKDRITFLGLKTTGCQQNSTFRGNHPKGAAKNMYRMHKNDIIKNCAGKVAGLEEVEEIGSDVAGTDMLKVRFLQMKKLEELPTLCKKYFEIFCKAQTQMPVSSHREFVSNVNVIAPLDNLLVKSIRQRFQKVEPEDEDEFGRIELNYGWTDEPIVYGEVKFPELGDTVYEELNFENYFEELIKNEEEKNNLESKKLKCSAIIKMLEKHHVQLCSEHEEDAESWTVKQCISFDTKYKGNRYSHDNGLWYKIDKDYIKKMSEKFNEVLKPTVLPPYDEKLIEDFLPDSKLKKEAKYNLFAANKNDYLCLDRMILPATKKQRNINKFELCDLLTSDGNLIHIKFYGPTASFGHIFNQARISGKLLQKDEYVRKKVYEAIQALDDTPEQQYLKVIQQKTEDLTVCYGVISNIKKLRLQAMILFYETTKKLEKRGYKVVFEWIDDNSPLKKTKAATTPMPKASPKISCLPLVTAPKDINVVDSEFASCGKPGLIESSQDVIENIPVPSDIILKSESAPNSDFMVPRKRKLPDDNFDEESTKREKIVVKTESP